MAKGRKVEMKKTKYRSVGCDPLYGEIVYAFFGKKCIFCGITPDATSTINAAEEIIEAITAKEKIDPFWKTFYDLQTHRRYQKDPGEYEFDRLTLKWTEDDQVFADGWSPEECPPDVLQAFHEFIWN